MLHLSQLSQGTQDLKVIRTFLESSLQPKVHPRNLQELSHIVRNRLTSKSNTREQIKYCREWLREKGMDIQPLIEYLQYKTNKETLPSRAKQIEQTQQNTSIQPILFNHEQYSQQALDYASATLLQSIPTKREVRKRQFKTAMANLGCFFSESSQISQRLSKTQNPRDKHKRQKYISAVQRLLDVQLRSQQQPSDLELKSAEMTSRLFFQAVGTKIFKILYKQLRGVDLNEEKEQVMTKLLIQSLGIVEEELNEELPLGKQAVTYYLQQKYLNKLTKAGEFLFDPEHGSLWGKAFLFFRAGNFKDAFELLESMNEKDLILDIQTNIQSIQDGTPKKVRIDGQLIKGINDIFRQQILYAIGGERKYSSDVLSNPETLDCLWILLRNTGIYFRTDSHLFEEMRTQMTSFYRQNHLPQGLHFSAYLLDYQSLASSQEGEGLDRDDLMHLLIMLHRLSLVPQGLVKRRLTEYAISYALELVGEERKQYVNYILMIPKDEMVEAASAFLSNQNVFTSVQWPALLKYLSRDDFRSLLMATSQKYVISTGNYLATATTTLQLNNDRESALNMLSQMLVLHLQQKRIYEFDQISKALRLYSSWLNQEVDQVYHKLLQLFQNSVSVSRALLDRNYSRVGDILSEKHLVCCDNVDYLTSRMLEKLVQFKGIEVFFLYLGSLARGADVVMGRTQSSNKLKEYKHALYKTAKCVESHHKFSHACNQSAILELIEQLSSSLIDESMLNYQFQD